MKSQKTFFIIISVTSILLTGCSPHASDPSPAKVAETAPPLAPTEPAKGPSEPVKNDRAVVPTPDANEAIDPLLDVDLLALQQQETANVSPERIRQMNEESIASLNQVSIYQDLTPGKKRISMIDARVASKLIDSMNVHPIVSYYESKKYDRPETSIGYCFGRATYIHLALLKLGVAKEFIRKAWVVGPMRTGDINWAFHVATIVRNSQGKWFVIDNVPGKLLELGEWVRFFYPENKGSDNLRVYITSPQKFSVSLSKYDRTQMGLDVTGDEDWYRHYFYDLMKWFSKHDLSDFGLNDLRSL